MSDGPSVPVVEGKESGEPGSNARGQGRSKDELALDLMKFVAVTTGYGKGATSAAITPSSPSRSRSPVLPRAPTETIRFTLPQTQRGAQDPGPLGRAPARAGEHHRLLE